jgi:hypothetical protein
MNRTVGLVFMIIGVVGIVVSLLLIPAIWAGRSFVDDQVATVVTTVQGPLQQAEDATGELSSRIANVRGAVGRVGNLAESSTGSSTGGLEPAVASRLLALIDDTIGPAYVRLREAYISVRERVVAASRAASIAQRVLPQSSLPSLPTDELETIDTQLQALDASLRQIRDDLSAGTLPSNTPGADTVRRIDDGVKQIDSSLGGVVQRVDNLQARVVQAQTQVNQAQATANQATTTAALLLTLFCVYLGLLHAALFAFGRQMRGATATATTSPIVPAPEPTTPPAPAAEPPAAEPPSPAESAPASEPVAAAGPAAVAEPVAAAEPAPVSEPAATPTSTSPTTSNAPGA